MLQNRARGIVCLVQVDAHQLVHGVHKQRDAAVKYYSVRPHGELLIRTNKSLQSNTPRQYSVGAKNRMFQAMKCEPFPFIRKLISIHAFR